MRHLRTYKLFETGEWSSDIDWDYVKENPEDDSEEVSWIRQMQDDLEKIQYEVEIELDSLDEIDFEIEDIRGLDMYQGPYAMIRINNDRYKVMFYGEYQDLLCIENFPIRNTPKHENPGFVGGIPQIAEAILKMYKPINREIKKYNL